ncbi:MAG TPA: DNA methyltransferase [Chthoniobacterales bacterium]|nr:DNA methyltransferase [Chthoniobacterales bacterium]
MPTDELKTSLNEFIRFAQTLRGDEKSEAQSFLDHFFRALGHAGVIEAGATFEFRIAKKPGSPQLELIKGNGAGLPRKGGKKFADLLWPGRVLIEMKSRGEKLEKHYDQTFEYWTHIVPHRPPFVILCNFDEFWIYDFSTQLFDPVDRVRLSELPENIASFNFLLPIWKKPIFSNNRVEVTRKAADQMATVFREIVLRGEDRQRAQRFILQLLVAMVAEDIVLLPREIVTEILFDCAEKGASSYDLIGGLFRQMATKEKARGGRFAGVEYFNGGLFEVVDPIELKRPESYRLHDAAQRNDWSKIRPEIFGTLFQDSMDKEERHAFGAHFTSEFDIRKVVGPTIVRPWRERIDSAGKNVGELRKALADLRAFRVLDPACGSGNFLFIAYREMKRLERDILLRLREVSTREPLESAISLHQFFGIDIIPFAVELAKVTLMLAKELEVIEAQKLAEADQLLIEEKPLPLDNLDKNIICADALFTNWPKADAIIGNPPFVDARKLTREHGIAYSSRVRAKYPDVPGRADFCVYWFRKTHDELSPTGRAGLVGTNSVRQNYSREGGLDYIVQNGGIITDAVSTQVWSGAAQVHVSIVNWTKAKQIDGPARLTRQRGDSVDSPWETFELPKINSALSPSVDVVEARRLEANYKPKRCLEGQQPGHKAFVVDEITRRQLLAADAKTSDVLFPILNGEDLISGAYATRPTWLIDLGERNMFDARRFAPVFEYLQSNVLAKWKANAERERAETGKTKGEHQDRLQHWWLLKRRRGELIAGIERLPRYIVCSAVTKRPIFVFVSSSIRPSNALKAFLFGDDYSFGVLQSVPHYQWFLAKGSSLKGDPRYTPDTVFDTFPWPQRPKLEQIKAVAKAAIALRALRRETMRKLNYSLRDLYRTLEQPGDNPLRDAHARLDAAVRAAYGMADDVDALAFLLELNLTCAAKEKAGEKITAPGLPSCPPEKAKHFVSEDCIQPPTVQDRQSTQ